MRGRWIACKTGKSVDGVSDIGTAMLQPLKDAAPLTVLVVIVGRAVVLGSDETEGKSGGYGNAVGEAETLEGSAGVCRLVQEDITIAKWTRNLEREVRRQRATVVHFEAAGKLGGKGKAGRLGSRSNQKIVNPDRDSKEIRLTKCAPSVKTGVMFSLDKVDGEEVVAKAARKVARRLFEPVLRLVQKTDHALAVRTVFDIAMRLFHEDALFKRCLQEGRVDIHMVEAEIKGGCELKDDAESCELKRGGECIGEVNTLNLSEAFRDPASFVLFERTIGEVFVLEDPLALDDVVARLVEYEFPRFRFSQRSHFLVGGDAPTFTVRTGPSVSERARFNVAVGDSGR